MPELGWAVGAAVYINVDHNHWSDWSQLAAPRKVQYCPDPHLSSYQHAHIWSSRLV